MIISKKDSDQTYFNLMSPSGVSCPLKWNSSGSQIPQSSLSNARNLEVDSPHQHRYKAKQLGHQLQEHDSSSTQSTGQSHHEVATIEGDQTEKSRRREEEERNKDSEKIDRVIEPAEEKIELAEVLNTLNQAKRSNHPKRRSKPIFCSDGTYTTRDGQMKPTLSLRNPNFVFPASQVDCSQSFARIPYTYSDPYYGGLIATCGPQAVIHPPVAGMVPARVPLPLSLAEDEPMYVNAKQYRAIIRRREARAKMEAQNRLVKDRKPYLHESRHLHALKRERGSGGRFLNKEELRQQQQSKPTSTTNGQNMSELTLHQRDGDQSESEFQSEGSEVGASTASCSEITDLSNNDYMLRQPDHMFSSYPPYMSVSRC